jgi:hypothetical protein
LVAAVLFVSGAVARAQTTLLFEGFEGAFPGTWSVGDANANGSPAYWDDVNAAFGGRPPHSGNWKGYCAGIGYAGTSSAPQYTNYMTAYMSRTLDLSGHSRVNLRFWNLVPSIETGWDYCRVLLDGTVLWSNGLPLSTWTEVATNPECFRGHEPHAALRVRQRFDHQRRGLVSGRHRDDERHGADRGAVHRAEPDQLHRLRD